MKKFLVLTDGYHDDVIVSDSNDAFVGTHSFITFLAKPHNEEYIVHELRIEDLDEDIVSHEVMDNIEETFCNCQIYDTDYKHCFNNMWKFAN